MGNSGEKIKNYDNFVKLYEKKDDDDNVFKILLDQKENKKFFLVQGSFTGDAQRAQILIDSYQKLNSVINIARLVEKQVENDQMLCFEKYKISLLFEYPGISLETLINKNKKNHTKIDEKIIWSIIRDLMEYLEDIRTHGVVNGDLQPQYIIINRNYRAYILSPLMYLDYQNAYNKRLAISSYLSTYSPELLENFTRRKNFPDVNEKLCEIFSLGICILSLASLSDYKIFYDFNENKVNFNKIKIELTELIEEFGYSDDLFYFLNLILKENYYDRTNYEDLNKILRKKC